VEQTSRRAFLAAGVALVAAPLAVSAQQGGRLQRVGFLTSSGAESPTARQNVAAFLDRLRDLGWVDGRSFTFDSRYAEWKYDRLAPLAAELVKLPVDVIFAASAPATAAAKRATGSIPIVFQMLGDPVSVGLVESLAKPGANLTGISGLSPELSGKRLELLKEAVPGLRRVFVLVNPGNAMTPPTLRETEKAAAVLGLKLDVLEVRHARRQDPSGRAPGGASGPASDEVRARHQSEDGESSRHHPPAVPAAARRSRHRVARP
jgi:putative ABC transport system substrate-binding protein